MLRRSAATVAILIAAVVALPGIAQAKFSASGSGNPQVNATVLHNATVFKAQCNANTPASAVTLTWTASTDAFVTSYAITRTGTGGPFTFTAAANAVSAPDAPATGAGNTYTYTIVAKVQNWVTTPSAGSTISYTGGGGGNKCQ